jgi:Flp pilus assembly protein TadG
MRLTLNAREALGNPNSLLYKLWHGTQGLAAVEMAFLAPVLAGIMIGVIDYGTAWTRQMALTNAVRAGTQYAMVRRPVDGDVTPLENAVTASAPSAPEPPLTRTLTVAEACACAGNAPGTVDCATGDCLPLNMEHYITFDLQEDYEMMFDWPFVNNPIGLRSQALLRLD